MQGRTHAAFGANAVWILVVFGVIDEFALVLICVAAFAALVPDIDAVRAKINYVGFGLFSSFRGIGKHRGFFHSLLACACVYTLSFIFLRHIHSSLPIIIVLGYMSHPFLDSFNAPGVSWLFPYKKRIHFLPKKMSPRVGGLFDEMLFIFSLTGIALFFLLHVFPVLKHVQLEMLHVL